MRKIIILSILSFTFLFISLFYRSELNKQEIVSLLEFYSHVVEKDLFLNGELSIKTKFLLDKYQINYENINKNENYQFSLSKLYFSYINNKELLIVQNYVIIT